MMVCIVFCRASLAERYVPFDGVGYECQITPRASSHLTYGMLCV
ncbi:hypothetical protein [Marinomonas sp. BSi20584]|nr:hypothetical protein [Marinomonas sp. BSi20584]